MKHLVYCRYFLEYSLVRILVWIINLFPIEAATWLARRIGGLLFYLMPKRRKVALENLETAFGRTKSSKEKRKIALEAFRHLPSSLVHYFNVAQFKKESSLRFRIQGAEHLDRAFARGRGAILVMSHLGHWEFLAFVPHLLNYSCTVLGKTIRNPYINRWMLSLRKVVSVETCVQASAARAMLTQLKQNHLVAITIDQWAGNNGLWVDFFGKPASTTSISARLAKKTGCALVPAFCIHTGNGFYEIEIKPEVLVHESEENGIEHTTKELNRILERQILAHPNQWLWTHKRWKAKKNYELSSL